MISCLRTCVCKQPVIALYFESENELKFYNLEARDFELGRIFFTNQISNFLGFTVTVYTASKILASLCN